MINTAFLTGLYTISASVIVLLGLGSWFVWHDIAVPVSLALGGIIGISPFVSWHFIMVKTQGFQNAKRAWVIPIAMAKYALIAAVLYLAHPWINVFALLTGIVLPMAVLCILGAARFMFAPTPKV